MANEIMITPDDVKRLKGRGFLRNKKTDTFSARIVTCCGHLSSRQLKLLAELAGIRAHLDPHGVTSAGILIGEENNGSIL